MFLARKIKLSKWAPRPELTPDEISADAVTADLRTRDLSLSLWECGEAGSSELTDVVLALGSGLERLEPFDIVWVAKEDLERDGCSVIRSAGRTPVRDLKDRHADVQKLDYVRLGRVAHRVVAAIERGHCQAIPKGRVKALLVNAVSGGRLDAGMLGAKIRSEVNKSLAASERRSTTGSP